LEDEMNKYNEPWRVLNADRKPGDYVNVGGTNRDGVPRVVASMYFRTSLHADRAIRCVNACEGIEDPAAALAEVVRLLQAASDNLDGGPFSESARAIRAALSLLTPKKD
jgi:hypothetical protein